MIDYFLFLGETSIDHYEFMGRYRKMLGHFDFIDEASEEISNSAYIATHTRIILRLKLLDELAFSTLRPVSHLHPFVEGLLATSGFAWINGLTGSGKTFVARRIGKILIGCPFDGKYDIPFSLNYLFFLQSLAAEYVIKSKRKNFDCMSEEFLCLFNFTKDAIFLF